MRKGHTAILGLIVFIVLALPVFCVSHDTFAAASTITLTIDDSLVDMNITSTSPNGNFNKSNPSTITVSTTNATGYTLSIAATGGTDSNNPTKLVNTSENTALDSVSSAVTESDFKAANGTSYNNKWGFLPSKYNSLDNTSFLPSPTTVADNNILNQTSTANSTADTFTVSIGARIDHTTKAGSYNNTFVIYATANAIPYTIVYDDNVVGNMPVDTAGETEDTSVTLPNNTPTRDGYVFLGWCTTTPTDNNGTDTCSGTTYQPGDSLPISQTGGNNNYHLYAMWGPPPDLYDLIAAQLKTNSTACTVTIDGKCSQNAASLGASITVPTSSNPANDTSNSGVFVYNSSVFGTSSDANNDKTIYYFRGILDSNLDGTTSTYGSNGDSAYYQNYVKLDDTCWRIVRTTGSGGVKMIYNGLYSSGTTANSCANVKDNAQVTTQAFGLKGNSTRSTWNYNINRIGYTFNNDSSIQDINTATSVDTVFGSNSNSALNNARSNIKTYLEDTWYTNNMTAFTSIIEPSAGYCNDRTAYSDNTTFTALTTIPPYLTSDALMYFGAFGRNQNSAKTPSLTCPRSTVDLYRYNGTNDVAGDTTANYLKYPVALLTADEASFAGSGSSTSANGNSYSRNGFLRSGSVFWTLSPSHRLSSGWAAELILSSNGYLNYYDVSDSYGVRPVISLVSGTIPTSGTGTATDPWVVSAP